MKPVKRVVLLHDLCGMGKAAMTNMLPILSVMGVEVCPLPTMLLSTHTGGYGAPAVEKISPDYIRACADHYKEQAVSFEAIFIGYLGDVKMVAAIEYFVSLFPETPVIFDPIMGDHGKYYSNFNSDYGQAMVRLLPYADVILPNLTECCLLLGIPFAERFSDKQLQEMCSLLKQLGAAEVIITSVPVGTRKKGIVLGEKDCFTILDNTYFPYDYHGTGDAFDGVFTGEYIQGRSLIECVRKAHDFVYECISESSKYDYPEREGLLIEKNLYMLV